MGACASAHESVHEKFWSVFTDFVPYPSIIVASDPKLVGSFMEGFPLGSDLSSGARALQDGCQEILRQTSYNLVKTSFKK